MRSKLAEKVAHYTYTLFLPILRSDPCLCVTCGTSLQAYIFSEGTPTCAFNLFGFVHEKICANKKIGLVKQNPSNAIVGRHQLNAALIH